MGNKKLRRSTDHLKSADLMERARRGDADAAHELIDHFRRGYPLEQLRELFRSESPQAVASAAYIASELGSGATPLVEEFPRALRHVESWGRSAAIDCVFNCASIENGELVAMALRLLDDPSVYPRGVALFRLRFADSNLIRAALPFLKTEPLGEFLDWLVSNESAIHASIVEKLGSSNALERRVALASAARPTGSTLSGNVRAPKALVLAASSQDAEVAEFARSTLQAISEIKEHEH